MLKCVNHEPFWIMVVMFFINSPHQAVEDFSELLVVLKHLLSELPPLLSAATHQPLLHQSPDVLHHHQPLGFLLQTLWGQY